MHNPTRRQELLSTPIGEQLFILDPIGHQSHCLSPAACKVWQMCDGTHDRDDMIRALSPESLVALAIDDDNAETVVDTALAMFAEQNLLTQNLQTENLHTTQNGFSRRDFALKLLKPGLAAALMVTLYVPPRAAAGS
jgi:hypothetical protein